MEEPGITIHVIRHGDKKGEELTPEGVRQALNLGESLRGTIPTNAIVKAEHSPYDRVRKTIEAVLVGAGLSPETIQKALRKTPRRRISISEPLDEARYKEEFKKTGQDQYVEDVLDQAERLRGVVQPPQVTADRMQRQTIDVAERALRLAKHYSITLPPVHLFYGTHQGAIDALAMRVTGKNFRETGGLSGFAEHLMIHVPADKTKPLEVTYKGKTYECPRLAPAPRANARLPPRKHPAA